MKITVELNLQSIKNAINALTTAKNQLQGEMLKELIRRSVEQIKSLANERIAMTDIGSKVKQDIMNGWEPIEYLGQTSKWLGARLSNSAEKAVYVEFGVGIRGQQKPHSNAGIAGYQYNMPSGSKLPDGTWLFTTEYDELDLPKSAIEDTHYNYSKGTLVIETKGTPATMYLYNAIVDFRDRQLARKIWANIKQEYWG